MIAECVGRSGRGGAESSTYSIVIGQSDSFVMHANTIREMGWKVALLPA